MAEGKNDALKSKLGGFADKLKNSQPNTPIQEVVPVTAPKQAKKEEKEAQLNVWIPKDLLKKMKLHSANSDLSLKEITIKALEEHLGR